MITNFYTHHSDKNKKPKRIVFLLHGLGPNGQDLISLAPHWASALPDTIFISPDAPYACDMVPAGYPNSYQWFSLQDRHPDKMLAGAKAAFPLLQDFLKEQMDAHDIGADKSALVGLSQGTMMSLYTAPRFAHGTLAGVLGYSGALIGAESLADASHKPPVCLIHGEADDVVPMMAYTHAKGALIGAGFTVSGHTTAGLTHSIDEQGIVAGRKFLAQILA